jgi:hypothetical protein
LALQCPGQKCPLLVPLKRYAAMLPMEASIRAGRIASDAKRSSVNLRF